MRIDRLKELRKTNHYTQQAFAEKMNIPRTTYAAYEQGKRQPDNELLLRFANIFNVSTDYLLGIKKDTKTQTVDLKEQFDDKNKIMTYQGRPIPEEDLKYIKRLLNGDKDDDD
ncbi:helix-turn-helix domain-containing protein [Lactiplantibacillus xiangfangensis]|uniref:helix-turn-helix domain-containing protein n=1 Tax=Lactiplantibacillus xiangfangensis TaxID=942150 RepID=UPI00384ADB57